MTHALTPLDQQSRPTPADPSTTAHAGASRFARAARMAAPLLAVGAIAAMPAVASAAPTSTTASGATEQAADQTAPSFDEREGSDTNATANAMAAARAGAGGPITRAEVIQRSGSWIQRRVMYSQSRYTDGYRQDCSGYVSMVWKLKSSPNSATLRTSAYTTVIPKSSLRAGDALGKPGHIALFVRWSGAVGGSAVMREEYSTGHPAEQRTWSASRVAQNTAYRYKNIR